ncbi:BnaA04g27700D [Brassica napus]|uniref:BnaA04g27700D protein n=1 Tax=Brassica napus TaxID=3708 RepID=A0A078JH07_BRANA|nr:BnaA04g27700D [Brassica napus]
MEEQREDSASIGDCKAPLEETGKELGLASKPETLDGEVDVPAKEPCVEDDVEKGVSSESDDVVKTDAFSEPDTERDAVDVKPVNGGGSHESAGEEGNEVIDEEANHAAEQNVQTEKPQQSSVMDGETLSVAGQEKESGDANMDVDSKQANEENVGSETNNGKDSESVQVPEETTQETTCGEEDTTHKEENGEAMDVDYTEEETLETVVLDDAGNEASMVPTQDVPIAEADSNVVKGMEVDERKDNADMAANPKSSSEDAAPREVEQLDQNGLFDPRSDITNFIDFSGVSSWSGNVQDLKTESGNLSSLKEDKKATLTAEEVATEEDGDKVSSHAEGVENASSEAHVATECPEEASVAVLGSDANQDTMREEGDTTHEAPNIDQNQQEEDTVMEENPDNSDYAEAGTDSGIKTNGVKRKADVSFAQRPSFKIGACIARAASQMAGSPSVLKGSSNLGDETLSVESFVSQLHSAATDPVKENVVSELATGFFLDFRNSSASQQFVPEKASSKRGRPSNSSAAGGTEAFEFEEMGDTYWTDRVIHNGGEEQTPAATEKENYQVVPVELKPAQVKRTRRPYRRRQSQISYPLPSASDKPADFDENAPAELIMYFSETDTIPSEKNLSKMFRHFGPIRDSQTEVDEEKNRARVVFRKGADADVAYKSAGKFNIFGKKAVNYELSFTITETFKVKPYVVSLREEEAAVTLPA